MDNSDKLQHVFDLCDIDKKGYISVEHFVSLAKEHFGAEGQGENELQAIVKVMDRTGDGQIHFGEFCQGVKQILELCSPSTPPTSDQFPDFYHLGHETSGVAMTEHSSSCDTHSENDQSTFNEYDIMTDDDQQQYPQHNNSDSAHSSSSSPPLPQHSSLSFPLLNSNGNNVIITTTTTSSTTNANYLSGTTGVTSVYSAPGGIGQNGHVMNGTRRARTPQHHSEDDGDSAISNKSNHQRREQEFEDYGDIEELDSETDLHSNSTYTNGKIPNRSLLSSQFAKRVSSSGLASLLYNRNGSFRSASSATHSRRSSCSSQDIYDDIDGSFIELNDKVQRLEEQISVLTENQVKSDEKQFKLKEENAHMVERIHLLEEQLREVEMKSQEKLEEEQKKHREQLTRTDKEKTQEIELLSQSLQHIEKEYVTLKEEAPRLKTENDRLKKDNSYLEEKLNESQNQLTRLSHDHREIRDKYEEEKMSMKTESKVNAQLIDELTRELEQLRSDSSHSLSRTPSNDLTRSQRRELEAHINRLKEEYTKVREQNEELQAQILSSHYQEGRKLLQSGASLAQEFENLPKDEVTELMKALKDQQHENMKLREYVDRITLRILEKNPSLLEIG